MLSDTFTLKSVSGDCIGEELYPKSISLRSVSGDIKIENKDVSRRIEVLRDKTVSGDIKIN